MNTMTWLKTAATTLLMALLAACGGGGGSAPPAGFVQPAWASPAMLVAPGQTSKTFSLNGCTWENLNGVGTEGTLHTATLVVSSTGTLTMNGATATTATISPVVSYSMGGQSETVRILSASVSNGTVTNLNLRTEHDKLAAGFDINQSLMGLIFNMNGVGTVISNATVVPSVRCNDFSATQTFALSVPPSDSRTQAVFVASGETARLSWLADSMQESMEVPQVVVNFQITSGGPALHLNQATGILSLADTTSTTATLRPLSISGSEYFNSAGSSSTYEERWDSIPAVGATPASQGRTVRLIANVPNASPAINLDVRLCSTTGPVQIGRCPSASN
jgi:hypothetical protein